jgi:hypothetical protein
MLTTHQVRVPAQRRPLSFRSLCMCDDLPEGFMRWLLPKDDEPLRELHIESSLSYRALKDIQLHAYTLHVLTMDQIPPQCFLDVLIVLKELTFCELPSSPFDLPRSLLWVVYHARGQQWHHLANVDGHHTATRVTPLFLSWLHALRLCFLLTIYVRPDRSYRLPDSLRTLPLSRYLAALVSTRLILLTFLFRLAFLRSCGPSLMPPL